MSYTSRYAGPVLLPEEEDVHAALSSYTSEGATRADWVSTDALWCAYRNWRALHRWRFDPDAPTPLTHRQFGRAIRRVFPNAERCFRTYHGERRWGYCYLRGPESIRSAWMEDPPE